jgi:hypothetical protein
MRLGDFHESADQPAAVAKPTTQPTAPELEKAMFDLHREFLRVDTLLRNLPDNM